MTGMELFDIVFAVFALITIVSAFVVVFSRNIMYAAFSLLFTFFGVAGLYVLLQADFLAITQVLIYVGGILVLLLFGIMLTNKVVNVDMKTSGLRTIPSFILCCILAATLITVFLTTRWVQWPGAQEINTTEMLGFEFMKMYMLPFEISSIILLVALVGAVMIARREKRSS